MGLEVSAAEIPAAEISATKAPAAPVVAGEGGGVAHVSVVGVEGLEEQERGQPVAPEEAVAGVAELVLVLPEALALVGVHEVLVGLRLREAGLELVQLLLALPLPAVGLGDGPL